MKEESVSLGDCSSSVDFKRIVKLQNSGILRNVLGSFQKSSEIISDHLRKLYHSAGLKSHVFGSEKVGRYIHIMKHFSTCVRGRYEVKNCNTLYILHILYSQIWFL